MCLWIVSTFRLAIYCMLARCVVVKQSNSHSSIAILCNDQEHAILSTCQRVSVPKKEDLTGGCVVDNALSSALVSSFNLSSISTLESNFLRISNRVTMISPFDTSITRSLSISLSLIFPMSSILAACWNAARVPRLDCFPCFPPVNVPVGLPVSAAGGPSANRFRSPNLLNYLQRHYTMK
jgi:hypothetical protein